MRALTVARRIDVMNEGRIKNIIKFPVHGLIQDPIAYIGNMDSAKLWILNQRNDIWDRFPSPGQLFFPKPEYVIFKTQFESRNLPTGPFAPAKFLPGIK